MLVYFSVILVVLVGFCGLAIDSGRAELRTAQLQAAADDAALVAATEYSLGNPAWATAAGNEATSFGTANGLTGLSTTAQQTATAGPYTLDHAAIEVQVSQSMPLTFLSLLTQTSGLPLAARAVGMVPPCSYFTNAGGFSMWLASAALTTSCPIYNNGNINVDSQSTLSSAQSKVVGPAASSTLGQAVSPAPIFNAPVLPDPLAYVVAPVFSSCLATGVVITSPQYAYPGTYCGGVSISNTSVTMLPGLYIITGGALIHNSTVSGSGVTIYFTQGGGSSFGTFRVEANSVWQVNAPTDGSSGAIPGVVLMSDRNWVGGTTDFQFDTSTYQGDGIIYTTGTGLSDVQTNMSGYNYFGFVTGYMYASGSNLFPSANYASLPGGNPFHIPARLVQ